MWGRKRERAKNESRKIIPKGRPFENFGYQNWEGGGGRTPPPPPSRPILAKPEKNASMI